MVALLEAFTMFRATATPTPILLEPSTALPSATAAASVSLDADRLNSPADLIVNPSASDAFAVELTRLRANPAATDIAPLLSLPVSLDAILPEAPSLFLVLLAVSSEAVSWSPTCLSALSVLPSSDDAAVPDALALAVAAVLA